MCILSNVYDYGRQTIPERYPWVIPNDHVPYEPQPEVTKEDFEALRREIQELKKMIDAAKRYDEATGQPDCEMDEKTELIKRLAELVGVDLDAAAQD